MTVWPSVSTRRTLVAMQTLLDLAAEQVRSAPPGIMHVVLRAVTHQPTLAVLAMLGIGALSTGGAS